MNGDEGGMRVRTRGGAISHLLCTVFLLASSASFALGGTITGTIGFAGDGERPSSVYVRIVDAATGAQVGSAWADAYVGWLFEEGNVPEGSYKLEFVPEDGEYHPEWWEGRENFETATAISVAAGGTSSVNPTLHVGGSIKGTIGFAEGGSLPYSVRVTMFRADTGDWEGSAATDAAQGWRYTVMGLVPGERVVQFNPSRGDYLPEWWQDASTKETATPVTCVAGATSTVNPLLDLGGFLSGTITFAEGGTLPDEVLVKVFRAKTGASAGVTSTDASRNWQYTLNSLFQDEYVVQFVPSGGDYTPEWWLDSWTRETAMPIAVAAGRVSRVNPTLDVGGYIAGTIRFAAGGTIPSSVLVDAFRSDTGSHENMTVAWALVNWNYVLGPLRQGTYVVEFSPRGWDASYLSEWWQGAETWQGALPIAVSVGGTATASPVLDPGGYIAGAIDLDGCRLVRGEIGVTVFRADTGAAVASTTVDAADPRIYHLGPLRRGGYLLEFVPHGGTCRPEWWQDREDKDKAAVVSVVGGATTTANPQLGPRLATLLWRHSSRGSLRAWQMAGLVRTEDDHLTPGTVPANCDLATTGDFNGDGEMDLLWRNRSNGSLSLWIMRGTSRVGETFLSPGTMPLAWIVAASGDFNGDGRTDILWRSKGTGKHNVWFMNGAKKIGGSYISPSSMPRPWHVVAVADFNADRKPDLLWRHSTNGSLQAWLMDGVKRIKGARTSPPSRDAGWTVAAVDDFNGDGNPDILWRNGPNGSLSAWLMRGVTQFGEAHTSPRSMDPGWIVAGYGPSSRLRNQQALRCESCHDGSVAQAPNVMRFWYGSREGQDGGHGDPQGHDRYAPPACVDCHDTSLPPGTHLDGLLQSHRNGNRTSNTSHLRADYFDTGRAWPPPPVGEGPWSIQVSFDNYCAYACHADTGVWVTKAVSDMRHERDTLPTDQNHWSVELGTHLTVKDGDALPPTYPTDADLSTDADPGDADYAPCVACHDPHGTGVLEPGRGISNRMLRDIWSSGSTLCWACHQ